MSDLRYSKSHEWVNVSSAEMQIGITAHAQELLGDMVFVELPEVGQEVQCGDEIGVLESVKAASDLYSPISGEVVAINDAVVANPGLLNSDPMGAGWLLQIKPIATDKLQAELDNLLQENEYLGELTEEL